MKARLWCFLLCIIFLCAGLIFAQNEQLTITTYYPSPYGSYNDLTVSDRMAIGDVNNDGTVNESDMAVCPSGDPTCTAGNPVIGSLTVKGRVGIGTATPSSKLELNGKIKITDGSQGVGKVLTSDANGVGSWEIPTSFLQAGIQCNRTGAWGSGWLMVNFPQPFSQPPVVVISRTGFAGDEEMAAVKNVTVNGFKIVGDCAGDCAGWCWHWIATLPTS